MKLAIIAAVGRNRVIGNKGKLPWHIPEDLKRFKFLTTGHAILMGRKTFESLGRPLKNRRNVVITSRQIPGIETYSSIPLALKALSSEEIVFVIGGGQVFSQILENADTLYLTIVDQSPPGDVFFPPYEHLIGTQFTLTKREENTGFAFEDFARTTASS